MKTRMLLLLTSLLLCCAGAFAQTPVLTWTASTSANVTQYKVYGAQCTGTITAPVCPADSAFTNWATTPATVLTATDTGAKPGMLISYYVTAVCPTPAAPGTTCSGESVPSVHVIMLNQKPPVVTKPNAPGSLTVTVQ